VFHQGDETKRRPSRVSSKKTFRTREVDYTFLLATNLLSLPAETIALLFSLRWQIELFFRWFKCVLGCNHLVALSKNGLTIQIYCALIASLLVTLWTGRKPTKRTFEMITLHFMGWASDEELEQHIEKLKIND
jgi:IS4 transposase